MNMKEVRKNNKGFSLVELIIVMAIMAILIGAIVPQVFAYVEESRETKDVQILDSVFTAVQTAIASEATEPASFDDNLNDVITAFPRISSLLPDDMNSETDIRTKAKSKVGTAAANTVYISYNATTGKIIVYFGTAAGTPILGFPTVTN